MKNFMDFKTFSSLNEDYYNDFSYIKGKERKTELAKSLERVRSRVKSDLAPEIENFDKPWRSSSYDAVHVLTGKIASGLLDVTAEVADMFGGVFKKGKKELSKEEYDKGFEGWKENLSPQTSKQDLEKYAEETEKVAIQRYGKDFDFNNPKTKSEKTFVSRVKNGEDEIVKRMKM